VKGGYSAESYKSLSQQEREKLDTFYQKNPPLGAVVAGEPGAMLVSYGGAPAQTAGELNRRLAAQNAQYTYTATSYKGRPIPSTAEYRAREEAKRKELQGQYEYSTVDTQGREVWAKGAPDNYTKAPPQTYIDAQKWRDSQRSPLRVKSEELFRSSYLQGQIFQATNKPSQEATSAARQAYYGYSAYTLGSVDSLRSKGREFLIGAGSGALFTAAAKVAIKGGGKIAASAVPVIGWGFAASYAVSKTGEFVSYEPSTKPGPSLSSSEAGYARAAQTYGFVTDFSAGTIAEIGGFAVGAKTVNVVSSPATIKTYNVNEKGERVPIRITYEPGNIGLPSSNKGPVFDISFGKPIPQSQPIDVTGSAPSKGILFDKVGTVGGRPARARALSKRQQAQRSKPSFQPFRPTVQDIAPGEKLYTLEGKGLKPILRQGDPVVTKVIKSNAPNSVTFEEAQLKQRLPTNPTEARELKRPFIKGFSGTLRTVPIRNVGYSEPIIATSSRVPQPDAFGRIRQASGVPTRLRKGAEFTTIESADLIRGRDRLRAFNVRNFFAELSPSPPPQSGSSANIKSLTVQEPFISPPRQIKTGGNLGGAGRTTDTPPITSSYQYQGKRYLTTDYMGGAGVSQSPRQTNPYTRGSPAWRREEALIRLRAKAAEAAQPRSLVPLYEQPAPVPVYSDYGSVTIFDIGTTGINKIAPSIKTLTSASVFIPPIAGGAYKPLIKDFIGVEPGRSSVLIDDTRIEPGSGTIPSTRSAINTESSISFSSGIRPASRQAFRTEQLLDTDTIFDYGFPNPQPGTDTGIVTRPPGQEEPRIPKVKEPTNELSVYSFRNTIPRILPPEEPIPPPPVFDIGGRDKKGGRYSLFVRRAGKFKPVGRGFGLSQAFERGIGITRGTAAASFKVVDDSGEVVRPDRLPKNYYASKKEPGVFIQTRGSRITTAGEKAEITLQGIRSSRYKARRLFGR
jgi:hypothetical protein